MNAAAGPCKRKGSLKTHQAVINETYFIYHPVCMNGLKEIKRILKEKKRKPRDERCSSKLATLDLKGFWCSLIAKPKGICVCVL